ncbi:MAG: hypothetical protein L6R28_03720 [Planctomycetes bacterium]|nr:hypothetical protein [Planctomycetota bacterium]
MSSEAGVGFGVRISIELAAIGLGLAGGVIACAETVGPPVEVYAGALGGGLIGVAGLVFVGVILRAHKKSPDGKMGRWDVWGLWGLGMLVRLAMLGALVMGFWRQFGSEQSAAMYSMAAVYAVLHFWETSVLYRGTPVQGTKA